MTGTLAVTTEQSWWNEQQLAALKQLGLQNASKGDLALFLSYAQKTGLDPFSRQIYMIERGGRYGIQASIDGLRIVAQRSGDYAGQVGPLWCGTDGQWVDVWLSDKPPAAAKVGVYRHGFTEPVVGIALWTEYAAGSPTWKKMPALMLAKCAEALALRKAFPHDLSGIYTQDEMGQVDEPARVEIVSEVSDTVSQEDMDSAVAFIATTSLTGDENSLKALWKDGVRYLDIVAPDGMTLRKAILARREELLGETDA